MHAVTQADIRKVFVLVMLPFLLNDFAYLSPISFTSFIMVDYGCRILVLGFLGLLLFGKRITISQLGFNRAPLRLLLASAIVIGVWCMMMAGIDDLFSGAVHQPGLSEGNIGSDCGSALQRFDYRYGLLLVALSEEVVFRGLALSVCKHYGMGKWATLLLSSLVFAAIHWSSAPYDIAWAFLFGIVFMIPSLSTGNIIPSIFAHYLANAILLYCP